MKRLSILFLLLTVLMGGSYYALRLETVTDWLTITLTLAMITVGPTLIYFLLIKPKAMPKLWIYLSFLACLGAAYLIIPSSQKGYLNTILFWLLPVIEVSVVLIVIYGIVKSVRTYRSVETGEKLNFLEVVENALKPKLGNGFILHAVLTELSVFYYSLFVWFKKPSVNANDTFTYHKDSQIKTIVILFSVLIVVEGVLFHFLLQRWSEVVAWIFTVLNAYGLLYIIGLYNSVKFLPHVIGENYLIIRLGYQSSIKVDIHNIARTQVAETHSITDKVSKDTYYSLLTIDSPQYEIILKEPALMKGSYGKKTYVNSVVFRADDSRELVESIESIQLSNSNNMG
ncbi:hypothetical protein ACQKDD_15550 [Planococcus kocurii]|uniref:hypothetical protein n=1 Tax=Planococcus kocurii TaxID=1374 RepID=UPI003CFDF6CC